MSFQFPSPHMSVPTPADQARHDGWSPARQRRFLETLAATGVIRLASEAVRITPRAAYDLRIRADGAAFRLGWDTAILIARARLADDLLARAIIGVTDTIRKEEDGLEITRHRHDNRLAMSMLSRLDRMADSPPEGSDAAIARIVAQDFAAYLALICPADQMHTEAEQIGLPTPGTEPMARTMDDARLLDGTVPDMPLVEDDAAAPFATALSPGASAALFVAARMALHGEARNAAYPPSGVAHQRCEVRPAMDGAPALMPPPMPPEIARSSLPPEEAVTRLRGIWWSQYTHGWRTDYPAPPGFDGDQSDELYDIDDYERDLSPEEEHALALREAAERRPFEIAAARARDAHFGVAASAQGMAVPMAGAPSS